MTELVRVGVRAGLLEPEPFPKSRTLGHRAGLRAEPSLIFKGTVIILKMVIVMAKLSLLLLDYSGQDKTDT